MTGFDEFVFLLFEQRTIGFREYQKIIATTMKSEELNLEDEGLVVE